MNPQQPKIRLARNRSVWVLIGLVILLGVFLWFWRLGILHQSIMHLSRDRLMSKLETRGFSIQDILDLKPVVRVTPTGSPSLRRHVIFSRINFRSLMKCRRGFEPREEYVRVVPELSLRFEMTESSKAHLLRRPSENLPEPSSQQVRRSHSVMVLRAETTKSISLGAMNGFLNFRWSGLPRLANGAPVRLIDMVGEIIPAT